MNLKIISAGAGSGKTYRLTQEMTGLLKSGVRANGIIATTFTTKAAAELQERVRVKLLEEGLVDEANELTNALIGTVHGLGVKLLKRFAFLAGVSPEVDIIADEDHQAFFNRSLATVLRSERIRDMEQYANRLGLAQNEYYDWRRDIKLLTDAARANDFSTEVLEKSKQNSIATLTAFLGQRALHTAEHFNQQLTKALTDTIDRLKNNDDATKKTAAVIDVLKNYHRKIKLGERLNWHEWAKISKIKVGAKSKDDIADLTELARKHDTHPAFHDDIHNYLTTIFDIAIEAIKEYDAYKKQRGLIDYIDMEIQVNRLLDQPEVRDILKAELDLLMVDEFQDTSPIQLEIFLKLSKIAKYSVWVGDPKQSIYGFRGAEPRLMMEIIRQNGGVRPEDIQENSWRSREDIVHLTNAIFTNAFQQLPKEQVALKPKRTKLDHPSDPNFKAEPIEMEDALMHWHFETDGDGRSTTNKDWVNNCLATAIRRTLDRQIPVIDRFSEKTRPVRPGDIAVLCRTNYDCLQVAEALHHAGLKAAIARTGLLETAEAKLILACLKYMLHRSDSLSVAEILLLGGNLTIEEILTDRLEWLKEEDFVLKNNWAYENQLIKGLNRLRNKATELSSTEILNLLLESLDLRRIMAQWGNLPQRLDNVDVFRKMALQYEENCNRLQSAASLGGFLLYLNELSANGKDNRGSGAGADAVNVLTYHKSKGLEWNIVICHNLENNLRDNLWGMNIVADSNEVNLSNILGNRWLRYWINPYDKQLRGTALAERIEASPVKTAAREQALQEEARLLYVGITRARDYLVFPTRNKPTKWLNRCTHNGDENRPSLDHNNHESIWDWNNQPLLIHAEMSIHPKDFPQSEWATDAAEYIEPTSGIQKYQPYELDASKYFSKGDLKILTTGFRAYSSGPVVADPQHLRPLAKVIYGFFIADDVQQNNNIRLEMANTLIARYEAEDWTNAKAIAGWSSQFYQHLKNQYKNFKCYKIYPIELNVGQQVFQTTIDWLLVSDDKAIIVRNTSFAGKPEQYRKRCKELAGWFALCGEAIRGLFKIEKVEGLVHFAVGGGCMGIQARRAKQALSSHTRDF